MVNPTLKKIKQDFDNVIRYSQGISDPKTDRLFEMWYECKKDFINLLDGHLIYEYGKVSFELDPKEKHDRVIRFAGQVESQWGYYELAKFIEKQEEGFFKNITVEECRGWDGKIIPKGMKLVKAFRHFVDKDDRSLADIQNEASRIIQEDKIEGTLCFSVHPLDYLSLSENTYNWRSCHSLDGEYRAGNLSYMMDKTTVVCYLKGGDDMALPNFSPELKWNSKKWRVLLYISEGWEMIFAGRQYPFESASGMDIVLKDLLPEIGICRCKEESWRWSDWNRTLIAETQLSNGIKIKFDSSYVPVGTRLVALEDLVKNGSGSKQFNDILYSSCYKPIYTFRYTKHFWEDEGGYPHTQLGSTVFRVGGYTYCLRCGKEECLTGADTMMCEECELNYGISENEMFTTCDNCGRRIYADDSYCVGNESWCQHCFDRYAKRCECCGDVVFEDEIHYHEGTQQYVCEDCLYDLNEEKENY